MAALLSLAVHAQSPHCPAEQFPHALPETRNQRLLEIERLNKLTEGCLSRADYFAYWGALLVSLGRGAEAIEVLERALLLAPHSPGVQFDYAQALAQGGDPESASALLLMLLDRSDLHPDFRSLLQTQSLELVKPRWVFGFQYSSLLGHETNLNSAPSSQSVTFTLSTGDVVLELDPAVQPIRGGAWLNSFATMGMVELGRGQRIYVLGDLRSRQSGMGTDYLQADGSVIWRGTPFSTRSTHGFQPDLRLGLSHLRFESGTLFRSWRGEASLEKAGESSFSSCRLRSGLAWEDRQFPNSSNNDGLYNGLLLTLHCGVGEETISLRMNIGRDRPKGDSRAGGSQTRSELGLGWTKDFGRFEAQLTGAYSQSLDSEPYSPLLANGATRRLDRYLGRLELRFPVNSTWQWLATLEQSRQSSNIALFEIQTRAVYSGFRARFD